MLDDIISKFAENKNITNFDFSLRPNHNIDNPFAEISTNIIDNLKSSVANADKSILEKAILDEAEDNINFSYKIYSQITKMKAIDEGLLFKARLIALLNELENQYDNESDDYNDLLNFTDTLTTIIDQHILDNELENAFIITMVLFETAEEMRVRNMTPFHIDFKEYITQQYLTLLLATISKAYKNNNVTFNNFCISEILQYINKFSYNKNIDICCEMLYCASILSNVENSATIMQAVKELQKQSTFTIPISMVKYITAGLMFGTTDIENMIEYIYKNIKQHYRIVNIVNTFLLMDDNETARKILEVILQNTKIPNNYKLIYYKQLQRVYASINDKKKFADTAKERFALGDKNAYFDAVEVYTALGMYEQEKAELHNIACKQVPIYDYCSLLADNKEFNLLIDRFNMIKSTKDISEAVKFMDDKGIALYDDNTNKNLLNILEEKTKNYKKLAAHVKNLLDLITI